MILNELGITLAARGEELEEIVLRANPALRETDRVLEILARQNRTLAHLATDSDAVLAPLARQRTRVTGFIEHAAETAEASAEERAALEEGLALFPEALREIQGDHGRAGVFERRGRPRARHAGSGGAVADAGDGGAGAVRARRHAGADEPRHGGRRGGPEAGRSRSGADPAARPCAGHRPGATGLQDLLSSLRSTQGFERLMDFLFYSVGTINGFDQYGHFLRALLIITNCNDYEVVPIGGCGANFTSPFVVLGALFRDVF